LGRIGLLAYLQRPLAEPSIDIVDPKEKLGVESAKAKLTYETSIEFAEGGSKIRINRKHIRDGQVFPISSKRFGKLEVETRAVELAVAWILASKKLLEKCRGELKGRCASLRWNC
jgi:hypothetical protein